MRATVPLVLTTTRRPLCTAGTSDVLYSFAIGHVACCVLDQEHAGRQRQRLSNPGADGEGGSSRLRCSGAMIISLNEAASMVSIEVIHVTERYICTYR